MIRGLRFIVWGLGFRVSGFRFIIEGLGVVDLWFWDLNLGFKIKG